MLNIYLKSVAWLLFIAPIYLFLVPWLVSAPSTLTVVAGTVLIFALPVLLFFAFKSIRKSFVNFNQKDTNNEAP